MRVIYGQIPVEWMRLWMAGSTDIEKLEQGVAYWHIQEQITRRVHDLQ